MLSAMKETWALCPKSSGGAFSLRLESGKPSELGWGRGARDRWQEGTAGGPLFHPTICFAICNIFSFEPTLSCGIYSLWFFCPFIPSFVLFILLCLVPLWAVPRPPPALPISSVRSFSSFEILQGRSLSSLSSLLFPSSNVLTCLSFGLKLGAFLLVLALSCTTF